jgi:hypothetical protein
MWAWALTACCPARLLATHRSLLPVPCPLPQVHKVSEKHSRAVEATGPWWQTLPGSQIRVSLPPTLSMDFVAGAIGGTGLGSWDSALPEQCVWKPLRVVRA